MCFPFVSMSCDAGGCLKTQGANLSYYIKDIFDQARGFVNKDTEVFV